MEHVPAIIYMEVDDPSSVGGTRISYMSPQVERVLGYPGAAFLDDRDLWRRLIHPDDRAGVIAGEARAMETGEPFRAVYRMFDRSGHLHWFRDEASVTAHEEGTPRRWHGVLVEVTEERKTMDELRRAEILYRSLVESLPMYVFVDAVDDASSNIYTSPQAEAISGYSAEEWMSDPGLWLRIIHADDRDRVMEANRIGHPFFDEEYRLVRKDGRVIWVRDVSIDVLDEDGEPLFSQGFVMDVTEQKMAQEALVESFERERRTADELRALSRAKNSLLRSLSEDLREPLTAIIAGTSALESHGDRLDPIDRAEVLRAIDERAKRMQDTIAHLLDLDRLEEKDAEARRQQVDLGALTEHLIARRQGLNGRDVSVDVRPTLAWVDPDVVGAILDRLLENAERHTPAGSRVWVRVEAADHGAVLAVEDDGPGVEDAVKECIFEPFRQGESDAVSLGMGVGLAYVQRHTALLGGRAWVEDRPGGGASFRVFFPS